MKIFVAGHRGMVGSAIVRKIESEGIHSWVGMTKEDLDLTNRHEVFSALEMHRPDAVIMAAAKVGGIAANSSDPVGFLSENLQIQTNLLDAAHFSRIDRLVFLGSSCIYPKFADQPIEEEALLTGVLEPTNESYAIAKIAGLKLVQAYRKQFGYRWISLMPTNLYGPGDNFDPVSSHVIPGMISKFVSAQEAHVTLVQLWGTGAPLREFLFVDDLADAILFALENYDDDIALNVGSGEEIAIRDLALLIADLTGFQGEIIWDKSMPDGTPRKMVSSHRISQLGWKASTTLQVGLDKVVRERMAHRKNL